MPAGLVRTDLNKTGIDYRKGNPVPPAHTTDNSNPVTLPKNFGIVIPVSDATFKSNPVTWMPSPAHFGNVNP
jgi:hypothetical protein